LGSELEFESQDILNGPVGMLNAIAEEGEAINEERMRISDKYLEIQGVGSRYAMLALLEGLESDGSEKTWLILKK